MAQIKALEKTIQEEVEKYQKLQKDFQNCISSRTKLDSQLNENKIVKDELAALEEEATVYKLVGPVLVKQQLSEAAQTVDKRLHYISSEIENYERQIKGYESKVSSAKEKLAKLQQEHRQAMSKAGMIR